MRKPKPRIKKVFEKVMENKTEITDKKQKPWLFKKGQSGNPNGRPVGSVSIVEGIKRKLLEVEPANKKTYLELFLSKLFLKAIKEGNEQLMKDMINRVDGMPQQRTDITSGDKPIPILNAIHSNHSSQEADETTKED